MTLGSKSPSLIKWTGSKRSQAEAISKFFPSEPHNYYEPFLGSGAVLYYATKHFKKLYASDIYAPLIEIWNTIKNNPQIIIDYYKENWKKLQTDFPNYYYEVRKRFNTDKSGLDLLFLSRTCVNGIIRFNDDGEFNNSLHLSRRGMLPGRFNDVVWQWNSKIKHTCFQTCDYAEILTKVEKGDFVYLDPPYANSHNRYINNLDIQPFLNFLEKLNRIGVFWALSFDGSRGNNNLTYDLPRDLFKYQTLLCSGNSSVKKVLNSSVEKVQESLYLNYEPPQNTGHQREFRFE